MSRWPYKTSTNGRYRLLKDGEVVLVGSEQLIWSFLHWLHASSVEHLVRHEGYEIQPDEQEQ